MAALAEVKHINLTELKTFLAEDHTSFSVLTAVLNQIRSTNKTSVTISKNSARNFYLGKQSKTHVEQEPNAELTQHDHQHKKTLDDCAKDFANCVYFKYFNRAGRRQYFRFLNKVEANFEGSQAGPLLFLTLTFNTTRDDLYAFTTN
jgi:predicted helicase